MRHTLFPILIGVLPLAAQINGPQLGYVSRDGHLRRIEGLSVASRLSDRIELPNACTRISTGGMRWALCATESETLLIDLRGLSSRVAAATPFTRAIWSPGGKAVVLDGVKLTNLDAAEFAKAEISGEPVAISDLGTIAEGTLAFDGEARLSVHENTLHRHESEGAGEAYTLDFAAARAVPVSGNAILAVAGQRLARIDRKSGQIEYFDLPAEATSLELLGDGSSVLLAAPAPNEPGWLFRWNPEDGGSVRFVPGIPVVEPVVEEVRQ